MDEDSRIILEPPKDIEAEKAVLGAMLKDRDARADVVEILRPEDFYIKEHEEIYNTMLSLEQKAIGVDLNTVRSALHDRKTLELVGGVAYLGKLLDDAIVVSNAKFYAKTVANKSKMRQLIAESEKIRESAYSSTDSPEDILDRAEQRIMEIAQKSQKTSYVNISDVIHENLLDITRRYESDGQEDLINTGFEDVDRILQGMRRSDLVILAARPGVGKTAWAINVAHNAASVGKKIMIFSLEMSRTQLGERLLSMESRVPLESIRNVTKDNGMLSRDDFISFSKAQDSIYGNCMAIDDSSSITPLEMKNKCRRFKQENGGLDLVVVDYLQLMSVGGYRIEQREKEIAAITRSLKIMAKELDCAVLLLSQLSREPERRGGDHMPKLADLRDSGAIEQDADIVIFLKRDDYYMDGDERAEVEGDGGLVCVVNIAKHRSGPTGQARIAWLPKIVAFGKLANQSDMASLGI